MANPSVDDLKNTWTARPAFEANHACRTAIALLAEGAPVTASALAAASGMSIDDTVAYIATAHLAGIEVEDGAIVGATLTLRRTVHRFRIRGHDLYTWCGFDALFLPIMLSERAHVTSTCPVTGTEIRLTVEADGTVSHATPPEAVVGIVGDDVTSCCPVAGPDSAICTQMPFFASRDAGERWLASHPGVAIVDLHDAHEIARAYVHVP